MRQLRLVGLHAGRPADAGPCGTTADTTLTVGLFGTFGFKEAGLWDAYQKLCPNITIKEDVVEQSADYWTRLKTRLASGSGLDDVQAIEIGFVADVVQNHADQFVNWNSVPERRRRQGGVLPLEVAAGLDHRRRPTVGLGTDIGPEAICYRRDLLKQAGLPSDPATLAPKWTTWDDFINFGKQYEASTTKPSGSHFVDSAASIFSTAVYQGDAGVRRRRRAARRRGQRRGEERLGLRQPGRPGRHHRRAPAVHAGLEQGLLQRRLRGAGLPHVDDGLHPGPGRRRLRRQVGHRAGAARAAPPTGAARGSACPTQAAHKDAAIALVEWLSAKDQQVTMWKDGGHFPSNSDAAAAPAVSTAKSAYFSNAPVGQIFGDIASQMKIPPIGLYDTQIQQAFTTQLTNVETKGTSPDDAFNAALDAIEQVTG